MECNDLATVPDKR